MPSLDHTHIYVARSPKKDSFRCDHPDCSHLMLNKSDLIGKRTVCAVCRENSFLLTVEDLRRKRPRCINCKETKEARKKREMKETLAGLGVTE